jgi:hypothetical protein
MSSQKEQYLEEFNKYKDITIELGLYRYPINNPNHPIEYIKVVHIIEGDVFMTNIRSGSNFHKTEHWVRKKIGTGKFIKVDSLIT